MGFYLAWLSFQEKNKEDGAKDAERIYRKIRPPLLINVKNT